MLLPVSFKIFTMKTITSLLIFSSSWFTNSALSDRRETIMTSSGPVQGTAIGFKGQRVKQYLGIPFAQPPVGELRFKKPQPVQKQSETIKADKMPPGCIQYSEYPFPWYDFQDGKSEDCLYLNIWVPSSLVGRKFSRKVPVMFWIYGGGFTFGSNRKRLYQGQALAVEGGIIVVTTNYRLGVFGFLTSGTEAAPRNLGIHDQLEALKWVNKNIEAFGGDPNQVTIAGESAGSVSVSFLCVSRLTKGLFHRAIMESGTGAYLSPENNTKSIAKSQNLAKAVGCADDDTNNIYDDPDKVVDCLRKIDAFELAKTERSFNPTSTRSFFPSYGDDILPKNPRTALNEGDFHNVDILIGNNHDEGGFQITTAHPDVFGFFGEKDPKVNKAYGESLLNGTFGDYPNRDEVIQHYLGNVPDDDYDKIRNQVYTAMGDFVILCPTKYLAEKYSGAGNNVFYYYFEHRASTTPWANWMGVMHFSEIQFVFGRPQQPSRNYPEEEISLSRRMVNIWSNFVKYGTPVYSGWPLYSRENPVYFILSTEEEPKYGKGPHERSCNFLENSFAPLNKQ